MRALPCWWFTAVCMLMLAACGGHRGESLECSADASVSACKLGEVCLAGNCVAIDEATVSASASAVGADANIFVIDAEGNQCEARECKALPYGSRVTFRAELVAGARFTGWSGSPECVGSELELVIEMLTRDTACVANYTPRRKATGEVVGVEGGGATATSDNPAANCMANSCEVDENTVVRLEAMDRWGERFVGWSGAGCGSNAQSRIIEVKPADADILCTATFQPRVSIGGKAMGVDATIEVTSTAQFRACEPGSCVIDKGEGAILNAPPIAGFRFAGWSGTDSCTGDNPRLVIESVAASQLCLATYMRRFTVAGNSAGATPAPELSAISSDQYANCSGASCEVDNHGKVTLLAWSSAGYRLSGWSGEGCGMESGAALEIADVTSSLMCTATYVPGIAVMGAVVGAPGDVKATSTTPGASCAGSSCVLPPNGNVSLEAPTIEGYRFQKWRGEPGCEGTDLLLRFNNVTVSRTCEAEYFARFVVRGLVAPSEAGSVTASSLSPGAACAGNGCTLDAGGEVRLQATGTGGYRFSGWSGGGACTGSNPEIVLGSIANNISCQANFVLRASVTGIAGEGGTVRAYSDSGASECAGATCTVDEGSRVELMATPAMGYSFAGWSECSDSREPALRINDVQRPVVCRARFVPLRYTVASSVTPAGSGTVGAFSSGQAAECNGGSCTVNYGSDVRLTANPAQGYRFVGWSGCRTGNDATLMVNDVRANQSCQASFARIVLTVTAVASPEAGGQVTAGSSAAGASCMNGRCNVPFGGAATLTATPARGYRFTDWSGCGASTGATLQLSNVTASVECRANFELMRLAVSGTATPADGGRIAASSAGSATCTGGRCSVDFGANVTLMATANDGFRFAGWSGCQNSTNASITINNVNADVSCSAAFERVFIAVNGVAGPGGTLTAPCAGMTCTAMVPQGGSATFTARPNPNFMFEGWSGTGCVASGLNATVSNVRTATTCTATFAAIPPPVFRVIGIAQEGGSLTAPCVGDSCSQDVVQGGSVTFTARPDARFLFTGWSGPGCVASGLSATVSNVNAATMCTASFTPQPPMMFTVTGIAGAGGTLTAPCAGQTCTQSVIEGGSVTFAAQPNPGFMFTSWSGAGCIANGNSATVNNVLAPTTCTASFAPEPIPTYTVTGTAGPGGTLTAPCNGAMCSQNVTQGGSITFTARPNEGFMFEGWSGTGCVASGLNATVSNVRAATTCSAAFARIPPPVFVVTGVAGAGGTLVAPCTGARCTVDVVQGGSASFTARENEGFDFVNWSGAGCIAVGTTVTVSSVQSAVTCTANFMPEPPPSYTVTATAGTGGSLTAPCSGSTCTATVIEGDSVTLTARENDGFDFVAWSGTGCASREPTVTLTNVRASTSCTASFEREPPPSFTITAVAGAGGSLSAPCVGERCVQDVVQGGSITLTAVADVGQDFVQWSGTGCASREPTVVLANVQAATTCTASFEAEPLPTFTVTAIAGEGGTLSAPCAGDRCVETVVQGGSVTLTAVADTGQDFVQWSGTGCASREPTVVLTNVRASTTCTASFQAEPLPTFTVTAIAGEGGTLTAPCAGATCTETVTQGQNVTLTARPNEGFVFNTWSGTGCNAETATLTLSNVRASTTCTASFRTAPARTFVVTGIATGEGSLAGPEAECANATRCSVTVVAGSGVTFTAGPNLRSAIFQGWDGDCSPTTQDLRSATIASVTEAGLSCTARFSTPTSEPTVPVIPGDGILVD